MSHIHEKIDFTVSVFVVHNNTVLLRMHEKYGIWTGPGGHIEPDEDPNQAAVREVKEETGLAIELFDGTGAVKKLGGWRRGKKEYKELIAPSFLNRHHTSETHEHVDLIYFATTKDATLTPGTDEAKTDMAWLTLKDLDDPHFPLENHIKHYALKALELLSP